MSSRTGAVATAWNGAEAPPRSSLCHQTLARRRRCRRCRFRVADRRRPFMVRLKGSSGFLGGGERDGFVQRAKWSYELRGEDCQVMWTRSLLFDPEGSSRQPGIGTDRLERRKHRTVGKLVPDCESETEVHVLAAAHSVVCLL